MVSGFWELGFMGIEVGLFIYSFMWVRFGRLDRRGNA